MDRRQFLTWSYGTTAAGLVGIPASIAAGSTTNPTPPGVAWRRIYKDLPIAAIAPAHDGGHVLVGRNRNRSDPNEPVRIALVDENGTVSQRQEIYPDIPEEARRARADLIRTNDGYAVATGSWLARLGTELSVETTGFASEYETNSTTLLVELTDGFAVAAELDMPNHVSTRVFGFDTEGNLQWAKKYGEQDSKWLGFFLSDPDGGLVVGGPGPWMVGLASDGTERWQPTVADAPPGVGFAATKDNGGITLFGAGSMVRLAPDRSINWQQSYEPFRDAFDEQLARTADGGYVVAAGIALDRIRVGRIDANGRLLWSHEYTVAEGAAHLNDIVERSPGEYLAVGAKRDGKQGWALLLSETVTPMATPEPTPTSTPLPSTTDSTPPQSTTDTTRTTQPGFGIGAALVGLASGLLARRR